jgi:ADP-ribosylglycohydrolase
MTRTSRTDPLNIDSVSLPSTGGQIGMTHCPGKKQANGISGAWARDLELDLKRIREWKAELILGLMESREYADLGVSALLSGKLSGIRYLHLPIPDGSAPGPEWEESWKQTGPLVRSVLRRGGRILIHCMGGLGRTGLLAARLLVEFGFHPDTAIISVRKARPGAIETEEQEDYIRALFPVWERLDRYRGCLLAGGCGDALGASVEFKSREEILRIYGDAGIREFATGDYGFPGAITDDTQMSLFTAEGLLRAEVRKADRGLSSYTECVNHAYLRWLATQGERSGGGEVGMDGWLIAHRELFSRRSPGATCLGALRKRRGPGDGSRARNFSKGCGGVMRAAPVGLLAATQSLPRDEKRRFAFATGCDIAALTHGHPTGQYPAGVLALLVLELIEGSTLPDAIALSMRYLREMPDHEETLDALETAVRLATGAESPTECIPRIGEGWIAEEALAISVFCSLRALSSEDGIIMAVNISGDSDSTGSITGNILGAVHGEHSLPLHWLGTLELHDLIRTMADDLATFKDWRLTMDGIAAQDSGIEPSPFTENEYQWNRYPG